mgnify:CR=1 FL=1
MCSVLKIKPEVPEINDEIIKQVEIINDKRKEKKYAESDELRKKLLDVGVVLEFTRDRTFIIKDLK